LVISMHFPISRSAVLNINNHSITIGVLLLLLIVTTPHLFYV
jgi:hypothetical protein